jgi:hypothetical protein
MYSMRISRACHGIGTTQSWIGIAHCASKLRSLRAFRHRIEDAYLFPKRFILGDEFLMPRSDLIGVVVVFGFEGDVQTNVVIEVVNGTIQFGTHRADREEDCAGMAGKVLSARREQLFAVGSRAIVQSEVDVVDEQRHLILQGPDLWREPCHASSCRDFNDSNVSSFALISSGSGGGQAQEAFLGELPSLTAARE